MGIVAGAAGGFLGGKIGQSVGALMGHWSLLLKNFYNDEGGV